MSNKAAQTDLVARIVNGAVESAIQGDAGGEEARAARKALKMALRLLKARRAQGNVEVNIFDDAATLAMGARKATLHAIRKGERDAQERAALNAMFAASQAVLAYWNKRTDDGSHVHDSPCLWAQEAERAAAGEAPVEGRHAGEIAA